MPEIASIEDRPLLTIAIPTYNRSAFLSELLDCLLPQLPAEPRVELLISDNASPDDTLQLLESFRTRGLAFRLLANSTNIGADANFLQCFNQAAGDYVWVLGDDEIILPDAIHSLASLIDQCPCDLVHLSGFGFTGNYQTPSETVLHDRLGRFAEDVINTPYVLNKMNALIGLVSCMIVNKRRLLERGYPPIEQLNGTNLLQVGWIFPLVHRSTRVLYVWERLFAYRRYNSGGWGVCQIFGIGLHRIAYQYLSADPLLARSLMNGVIRYWMCDSVMDMRLGVDSGKHNEDVTRTLQPVYGHNWRYWIFVYPIAVLPLPLARAAHAVLKTINKLTRALQAVLRHIFRHGAYLRPI